MSFNDKCNAKYLNFINQTLLSKIRKYPQNRGRTDLHQLCDSLMNFMKFYRHKRGLEGAKVFHREQALANLHHTFKTCGGLEAFTSTTISVKCGVKLA